MSDPADDNARVRAARFERNLALVFALLGLLSVALIALHWLWVIEPMLHADALGRVRAMAQVQADGLARLLASEEDPRRLRERLRLALDEMLLIEDAATHTPFVRRIALRMDYEVLPVTAGSLDLELGADRYESCLTAQVPLYLPKNYDLAGVATFYFSPHMLNTLLHGMRLRLLWSLGGIVALIGLAWWGASRTLRRLAASEANVSTLFEVATVPLVLVAPERPERILRANRAALVYLALQPEVDGWLSSAAWRTLQAIGLPRNDNEPLETRLHAPDGSERWALISSRSVTFSAARRQLVALVDVSELKATQHRLRQVAVTDGLTGLFNRRYLYEKLREEIERAERYGTPFSVFLFDLDHFKHINDCFGHAFGDEVLIEVAATLRRVIRETDIPGRYGGEEFLLVLPHTAGDEALRIAQRLRATVAALRWSQPDLRVTLSGGVSEYAGNGTDALLESADAKLYEAKHAGRNQVFY